MNHRVHRLWFIKKAQKKLGEEKKEKSNTKIEEN